MSPKAQKPRSGARSAGSELFSRIMDAAICLDQIHMVLDDGWQELHAVLRFGCRRILTHFGWTDVCILRAVLDVGRPRPGEGAR
jgi:hypothetical protein